MDLGHLIPLLAKQLAEQTDNDLIIIGNQNHWFSRNIFLIFHAHTTT